MKTSKIFEPLSIGKFHLKNRIAMAPMTRGRAGKERVPGDLMAEYYFQRAGAGLLITEATVISKQGIGWIDSPGIFTDAMVEGWQKVTEKVKPTGTPIFLQLWHCGRASHSDFHDGNLPVSASAVKLNGDHIHTPLGSKPYETPRSLSVDEIKATVNDYRKAAENAKAAGFSGVEVHGANGYLINQFLDATTNQRDDQYGGSFENRFRFFREVLERELFLYVTKEINKLKLGYLHIMDGLAFGFHEKGEPMTLTEFRRPFITNPDLPERYRNNWPLNPAEDMSLWYTPGPEGYTDYAPHKP